MTGQAVFQIDKADNVATALEALEPGIAVAHGDPVQPNVTVAEDIPTGHKLALYNIACGENIVKYGVVIGCATQDIQIGQWVHLHNMKSLYDARSSSLDVVTGAPTDTHYE